MHENIEKLALKGTTTVGVVCTDGVILSSDTRVTMGYFVAHKQGKKIYQIDDHIAMTISGGVADAQYVVEVLKVNAKLYKLNNGRPMPIKSASRLSRKCPLFCTWRINGTDSCWRSMTLQDLMFSH